MTKTTGGQTAASTAPAAAAPAASPTPPASQDTTSPEAADQDKPDAAEQNEPETTGYKVAPGRTVGGKAPGETVELTDAEALRFYELGFILDEDGNRAGFTDGPKTASGIEIKEV